MSILQEYKVYLIIAIIALLWVMTLFFTLQDKNNYSTYSTTMKANYVKIKALWEGMNVKKVLISNNDSLIWTTDNVLFWKKLLKDVKDIEIVDKDSFSPNPNVKKGEYDLTIVSTLDLPESRIKLNDITSTSSDTAKGVYLDSNGLMVYTFNSKKEALEVQNTFLPKSIYKDKSLFVTFEGSIKNLDIKKEVDIIFYIAPPVNQNELLLTLQNTPSNWSLYEPQLVQPPIIYSSIEEDIISNWRQLVGEIEVLWTKYFYKVSTWVSYINDLYWKEESDIWNGSLWNLIQFKKKLRIILL